MPITRGGEDDGPNPKIGRGIFQQLKHAIALWQRQGVAGIGPIQDEPRHAAVFDGIDDLVSLGWSQEAPPSETKRSPRTRSIPCRGYRGYSRVLADSRPTWLRDQL